MEILFEFLAIMIIMFGGKNEKVQAWEQRPNSEVGRYIMM